MGNAQTLYLAQNISLLRQYFKIFESNCLELIITKLQYAAILRPGKSSVDLKVRKM